MHISISASTNDYAGIITVVGGFILIFGIVLSESIGIAHPYSGLVSFAIKERLFLSESLVATLIGIVFGECFARELTV
jgi:hypothetical protein